MRHLQLALYHFRNGSCPGLQIEGVPLSASELLDLPAGAAIAEHILESSYFKSSKRLGVYLHCAALRECDTTLLVDTVLQRGVQISHLLTYGGTLLSGCGFQQYQIVLKLCFTLQAMQDAMFLWSWTKPLTCACYILVCTTCQGILVAPAHEVLIASRAELNLLALQALYDGSLAMGYPGYLLTCHSANAADAAELTVKHHDLTPPPFA